MAANQSSPLPRNIRYSGKMIWDEARIRAEIARLDGITGLSGAKLPILFFNARRTLGQFGVHDPNGAELMYFRFSHHWFQRPDWPAEHALDVIRHEYAHYVNWVRHRQSGHNSSWKKCCILVGARPERLHREPENGQPTPDAAAERKAREDAERKAREEAARKAREAILRSREEEARRMQGETALNHRGDESFLRLREEIERMRRESGAGRPPNGEADPAERRDRCCAGRIVRHPTLGLARICAVTGSGSSAYAVLEFARFGRRSLPLSWVADNCRIVT